MYEQIIVSEREKFTYSCVCVEREREIRVGFENNKKNI